MALSLALESNDESSLVGRFIRILLKALEDRRGRIGRAIRPARLELGLDCPLRLARCREAVAAPAVVQVLGRLRLPQVVVELVVFSCDPEAAAGEV